MARLKWALAVLIVLYGVYAALMVWLHPKLIYPFYAAPFAHPAYARHDLPDGPVVYVHDAGAGAPLVVYFMGNVGALGSFLPMLEHHRAAGRSVVAMGYRGGGGLPGVPSETALKADALLAFDAAQGLVTKPGEVIVQGYSLGTGLVLHVAARRAPGAVILSAPYHSLCRLMARASYLPACFLPGVQTWRSNKDARQVGDEIPVLILHGTEDRLIPLAEGEKLWGAFDPSFDTVQFWPVNGAGHTNLMSVPIYLEMIEAFIRDEPNCDFPSIRDGLPASSGSPRPCRGAGQS